MNTYIVRGMYRLWNDPTLPRENFSVVVVADSTESAIQVCHEAFREAEIISVLKKDEGVLIAKGGKE